jgi:hypothetical protein
LKDMVTQKIHGKDVCGFSSFSKTPKSLPIPMVSEARFCYQLPYISKKHI